MTSFGMFLLGFVGVIVGGWVARWIASAFLDDRVASIVAASFMAGAVTTRGVHSGMMPPEMAASLGSLLGLAVLLVFARHHLRRLGGRDHGV